MFKFEKLDVWHDAIALSDEVYRMTSAFPDSERLGLTNQMRRAAVSIAANIAEGSGRVSSLDFGRFVEIAYGSLMECVSHAAIAKRQQFLTDEDYQVIYQSADKLGRMLSGLRQTLKSQRPK